MCNFLESLTESSAISKIYQIIFAKLLFIVLIPWNSLSFKFPGQSHGAWALTSSSACLMDFWTVELMADFGTVR